MRTFSITYKIETDKFDEYDHRDIITEFDLSGNSEWLNITQITEYTISTPTAGVNLTISS